ncbi:MAG: hypothetical protein FJ029_07625 [Actinobacteria bacterium]|nr:hypothetical protein [Actinomycetota bacterium]
MPLKVPEFLLRRLYVKGSLRRTSDGFAFELKNTLGSGYARRLRQLAVDGAELALEQCFFEVDGSEHPFADVTPETPFSLALNRTSVLRAHGYDLPSGPVRLRIGFEVQGLGAISFEVTDTAAVD